MIICVMTNTVIIQGSINKMLNSYLDVEGTMNLLFQAEDGIRGKGM